MSSARASERAQSIATTAVFCVFILTLSLLHLFTPDRDVSRSERRKLQQFPEFSVQALYSGRYMTELEDYLCDQFPLREEFRTLGSAFCFYGLHQMDNKGIYLLDGSVYKLDSRLDEKAVGLTAAKISEIQEAYLRPETRVFYSVIPDKNYFASDSGYPVMEYDKMLSILDEKLSDVSYIDIFGTLDISDYYRTDIHWRQDRLLDTSRTLLDGMGVEYSVADYASHSLSPFYGAYYGQAGLPVEPDELVYMTSALTESTLVTSLDPNASASVYAPERIDGMDGYDVYLSGAQSVITMERDGEGRELVLFRDSFGSSIAPLLLEGYSKITLVDLRYISSDRLGEYVSFENADILFLYSTTLVNSGGLLK